MQISDDWLPTREAIEALPYPLLRFIRDLQTRVEPGDEVRAGMFLSPTDIRR